MAVRERISILIAYLFDVALFNYLTPAGKVTVTAESSR